MTDSSTNRAAATPALLRRLRPAADQVLSADYGRLLGRWRRLSKQRKLDAGRCDALRRDLEKSAEQRAARAQSIPDVHVDPALPIAARADEIIEAIGKHQVLVIAGETGSGKTTQLPKLCLAAGRGASGLVGCTQPRRLAARSMARRVAEELVTRVGDLVGFQVRFADQVSAHSLVKFMTDGILLAETRRDPWLAAYDTLIIDEAHERSLNIDFLLGYLKRLARKRPALKIIITSATIDTARFAEHFGDAPVIEVEGRGHPVEVRWRPLTDEEEGSLQQGSAEHVARALDEISTADPRGDVLVFLPGEREIRDVHRVLLQRDHRHTEIMPLYARLSAREQDRVFNPGAARRVVLATNIAETSLTVPRIRYVIDTGTARVKRYSQRRQLERLHVEPISQAAADQRKGRCGRLGPGVCVRLYAEDDFAARPRYTDPELLRSGLANVTLRMLDLGLGDVGDFPFLDPPEPAAIADGYRRLQELQAVDDARQLTPLGKRLAHYPIDAPLARMLVEAERLGVLEELRVITAFLSIQDPRERPREARGEADAAHRVFADPHSDFVGILNLWKAHDQAHQELSQRKLRDWCRKHFVSYLRMREWRELHRQLRLLDRAAPGPASANAKARRQPDRQAAAAKRQRRSGKAQPGEPSTRQTETYEAIHRALLSGLPLQVARKDEEGQFRSTRQRRFKVFPGSDLANKPPPWLLAAQILDMGGRVWGMLCARVEPRWVEQQAAHLIKRSVRDPHWSQRRGKVVASEQASLFGLILVENRRVTFARQDPQHAHALFLEQALATCEIDSRADFVAANRGVLEKARQREARERRQGLVREPAELAGFFKGKLPETISSRAALDKWYRKAAPAAQAALHWSLDDVLDVASGLSASDYPGQLAWQGQQLKLAYRFVPGDAADGVTLSVPLALLNAVPVARCQWLVPGMLPDKVAALIRALPKKLRRNFVPAPDFARAFCEAEEVRDTPLSQALAGFLTRTTGVDIEAAAFADADLPAHLLMRYRLLDEQGRELDQGRDLEALRRRWQGKARQAFARQVDARFDDRRRQTWDCGELPESVPSETGLEACPALVDVGDAVAVRMFERRDEAEQQHRKGVARLLRLRLAPALKRARRQLPLAAETGLKALSLASVDSLREDLVEGALRDLLADADLAVRDATAFDALASGVESALFRKAMQRFKRLEAVIEAHADLREWLEPPLMGFATASYEDLAEQLGCLVGEGFARDLSCDRLAELPRYLQAMRLRAERLRQDPKRDQQRMLDVQPTWRAWLKLRQGGAAGPEAEHLRWMIEEFRVSLFAQELGTAEKVSAKRLARQFEQVRTCLEAEV